MGLKVLIVEDEPVLALGIARFLRLHDFEIAGCAGSVGKALALIDEVDCDIAVLDVNLRGESVVPVATSLGQRGRPFIFMTGYDRSGLPEIFSQVPLLSKPFDPMELVALLRQMSRHVNIA